MGASILEKHFTSDKKWPGPDIPISIDPDELKDLIYGCQAVYKSLGGSKNILEEEKKTAEFAYACLVSIKDINKGDMLTGNNIWVKRPGTGEIKAKHYFDIINKRAKTQIKKNSQLKWSDIE